MTLLNPCVNSVLTMITSVLSNKPPRKAVAENVGGFDNHLVFFSFNSLFYLLYPTCTGLCMLKIPRTLILSKFCRIPSNSGIGRAAVP